MKYPLNENNDIYILLNEYLNFCNNRIEYTKDTIQKISIQVNTYNTKLQNDKLTSVDRKNINILQEKFINLGLDKNNLNEIIRKIEIFDINLSNNTVKKNDPIFEDMMNHFLETENFEYCKLLYNILTEHFYNEDEDEDKDR